MIYTFYSFKGGVGRSMALANAAELLCSRGVDVLVVDFDLEAPGLERFFGNEDAETPHADIVKARGVVDLILSYKTLCSFEPAREPPVSDLEAVRRPSDEAPPPGGAPVIARPSPSSAPIVVEPFNNFVVPIYTRSKPGRIWLMPAGRRDEEEYGRYADRVSGLDLVDLYRNWGGQEFFDWFVEEANKFASAVLIDSRTGITEMSGVCTHHLADAVVLLVAPNEQNIEGAGRIIRSLKQPALIEQGRRGRPLSLLVVPSRVENSEGDKLDAFADRFEKDLRPHIDSRLSFQTSAFVDLKIPYVPHYAYVEQVAAREAQSPKAADLVASYGRMTTALVELAPSQSLVYQTYHSPEAAAAAETQPEYPPAPPDFIGREWAFETIDAWLRKPEPQVLLITGAPGTGKSALIARFLERHKSQLAADGTGRVAFVWKCEPWKDSLTFVNDLARALAAVYPLFLQYLNQIAANDPQISLRLQQRIGSSERNSQPASLQLQALQTGLDPGVAFRQIVLRPLQSMYQGGFSRQIVIVIDALDAEPHKDNNLISLLATAPSAGLPSQVRLLLASRKDVRVLQAVSGERFDIAEDAPESVKDVAAYATHKLDGLPKGERDELAQVIASVARGNFLIAKVGLEALPADISDSAGRAMVDRVLSNESLASSLASYFQKTLNTTLSANFDRWAERYRPVLAVLAVARAPLSCQQVVGILHLPRTEVVDSLRAAAQFVTGNLPDGPFGLFHPSFAEFLFRDPELGVDAGDSHERIATYFIDECGDDWASCRDDYALRYTADHLMAVLRLTADRRTKHRASETLSGLLTTYALVEARVKRYGTLEMRVEMEVTLRRGELGEEATNRLRAVATLLDVHAHVLDGWDPERDPDLFARCVRESADLALLAGFPLQAAERATGASDAGAAVAPPPTQDFAAASGRSVRFDAASGRDMVFSTETPPSIRIAITLWRSARRVGAGWLAVATLLCFGPFVWLFLPAMSESSMAPNLSIARNLYILVGIGAIWGVVALFIGKRSLMGDLTYDPYAAVAAVASTSAMSELLVVGEGRCYRLIGSMYAASPYLEIATVLYIATFVLFNFSDLMNPIGLFGGFTRR